MQKGPCSLSISGFAPQTGDKETFSLSNDPATLQPFQQYVSDSH